MAEQTVASVGTETAVNSAPAAKSDKNAKYRQMIGKSFARDGKTVKVVAVADNYAWGDALEVAIQVCPVGTDLGRWIRGSEADTLVPA